MSNIFDPMIPSTSSDMKSLPSDVEAERALLGCLFAPGSDSLVLDAQELLAPEYFHAPQNKILFEAGCRLANRGDEISVVSLSDEVGDNLHKVGGFVGIVELVSGAVDYYDFKPLARIIKTKWEARQAILALSRAARAIENDGQVGESLNGLQTLLGALEPQGKSIVDHADLLDLAAGGSPLLPPDRSGNLPGFGIGYIDTELCATARRFGVIAAKTSAGKSSFAYQIVVNTCLQDRRVLLVSLESDREEVAAAVAANLGRLNRSSVMKSGTGGFWSSGLEKIKKNFHGYYASSGSTWDALERSIRAEHRRCPFAVVIVDYFTLLQPPDYKGRNLASLFGEISKAGKRLAQELECSVIFLSQFNRGVEDGQEPHLENLRETGQLEQDADWVLLMWAKAEDESDGTRVVYLKGAKNRGGKRNFKGKMTFYPAESRFEENHTVEFEPEAKPKRRMS